MKREGSFNNVEYSARLNTIFEPVIEGKQGTFPFYQQFSHIALLAVHPCKSCDHDYQWTDLAID